MRYNRIAYLTCRRDMLKENGKRRNRVLSQNTEKENAAMLIIKTQEQFEREVLQADKPVMVDFYADWCGPCKALAPLLADMDNAANDYYIGKVNVDENPELASQYKVASIPTVLIFKNGECVNRSVGLTNRQELEALLA